MDDIAAPAFHKAFFFSVINISHFPVFIKKKLTIYNKNRINDSLQVRELCYLSSVSLPSCSGKGGQTKSQISGLPSALDV
ncbi:hypothetical protein DDV21_011025 [Streptococcus chenjunshii]|uniref:Uncharacterized protein n=1 Tax=Streptococcus chenjunshii TaxID=2173853 RepID=A0A372KML6_9STRE|nr:hypothetical protein DDV21_011025 [Streptococcus chenjunshii]RFU51469.1 hypothetical protein DDV22_03080 [Streptococcus chenjunshii]RFU53550.1 hypothetical protein DDV23_04165 [Streptococcus chenjunshii]